MCHLLGTGFRLTTLPCSPDWWSVAEMDVVLEGSLLTTEQCWSSVRVTIGFSVTSLTKACVLVVPNVFCLWMIDATLDDRCTLLPSVLQKLFYTLPQIFI